ncbi:MAG TPA: LysR family transcriptional regulator [Steroidobacteraceae bacterium]|nr:LysR family transcriptional regulator [Steroidobacteraceae bacterium]
MHFNRLDLNLLVALDALLTEQNVTRAAERMHISQPAMSGALQRLRTHLNDPLLQSAPHHRLQLTPRARRLAGPVKELLLHIQTTLASEPEFDPGSAERYLQLAMSSYCTQILGAALMSDLQEKAPRVRCRFHELSADSLELVANGEIDFCVTLADRSFLDPASKYENLRAIEVFSDRFVLVAAAQNERTSQRLDIATVRALPSVEVRLFGDMRSIADRVLHRYDAPANSVAIVSSYHLALAMVSNSSLIAIVPETLARRHARTFGLKIHRPDFHLPELVESVIWHVSTDTDPAYVWLRQRLLEVGRDVFAGGLDGPAAEPANGPRHVGDRPAVRGG